MIEKNEFQSEEFKQMSDESRQITEAIGKQSV